jgi:hypothetical protein
VFLTSDPTYAPTALLHSLNYKVLHQKNVILTIDYDALPRIDPAPSARSTGGSLERKLPPRAFSRTICGYLAAKYTALGLTVPMSLPRATTLCARLVMR